MKNNIYRQNNASSWIVRWRVNGVKKSKSFSDKKFGGRAKAYEQAEAFLKITEAQVLQGDYFDPHRNKISLNIPICSETSLFILYNFFAKVICNQHPTI